MRIFPQNASPYLLRFYNYYDYYYYYIILVDDELTRWLLRKVTHSLLLPPSHRHTQCSGRRRGLQCRGASDGRRETRGFAFRLPPTGAFFCVVVGKVREGGGSPGVRFSKFSPKSDLSRFPRNKSGGWWGWSHARDRPRQKKDNVTTAARCAAWENLLR